jgi:hypothetical protein
MGNATACIPRRRARRRLVERLTACALLAAASLQLGGCSSFLSAGTADAAGVAGAGIAGAVSRNATVGAAIGLGVASVANAGLQYGERVIHRDEQNQIAATAGVLPEGAVGTWRVSHAVPIEPNEHGEVMVNRSFGGADFTCREIVFSVDSGTVAASEKAFYIATVCRDGDRWKWASAEPATERWGSLQ